MSQNSNIAQSCLNVVFLLCSQCHSGWSVIFYWNIPCLCTAQYWDRVMWNSKFPFCSDLSLMAHKFKLHMQHSILISTFSTQTTLLCLHPSFRCHSLGKWRMLIIGFLLDYKISLPFAYYLKIVGTNYFLHFISFTIIYVGMHTQYQLF